MSELQRFLAAARACDEKALRAWPGHAEAWSTLARDYRFLAKLERDHPTIHLAPVRWLERTIADAVAAGS